MTHVMSRFRIVAGSALIAAAALLAGCSGSGQTTSTQETAQAAPAQDMSMTTTHLRQ